MLLDQMKEFPREVQDNFQRTCNILLSSNYISKDKKDNTTYSFIAIFNIIN